MPVSEWIPASAAVVAALAAVVSAYFVGKSIQQQTRNFEKQSAAYGLSLSADTALKFDTTFNAPTFKKVRSRAAKALLTHTNEAEAEDVFDFFDTLGLFVRLGALNNEVVHSLFFHWINLYWKAGKGYVGSKQMESSTVWKDFKNLYDRVQVIERQRNPDSEDLTMPDGRLRQQLQEEIDLR